MKTELYNLISIIIAAVSLIVGTWATLKGHVTILTKSDGNLALAENKEPFFKFLHLRFYKRSSMRQVSNMAEKLTAIMNKDGFFPTIIIGIGRGGAIWGAFLSYHHENVPLFCMDRNYDWEQGKKREVKPLYDYNIPAEHLQRVLLVAGEAHSGDTMDVFFKHLESMGASQIKTSVFFKQDICGYDIDYVGKTGSKAVLMPWQSADFLRDSLKKSDAQKMKTFMAEHSS